jgi:hypothetical protein
VRSAATNWQKVWARLSLPRQRGRVRVHSKARLNALPLTLVLSPPPRGEAKQGSACSRLLLAALLSALAGCGSAANHTLEETFEQIYTIEPTANVTVINGDGAVFVYGSNTNEMGVQAIKRAYTRERLKQIAVNVSIQPGSISINTKFPPKPKWALFDRSGTVDYTIVVPATANLARLELGAGELFVDGLRGQRGHARLGSGRMFAHNCFGNVALTLDRGTLTLAYDWWEPGKFSIQTNIAHGNASAFFPPDIVCHLVAETGHGKIESDFEESAERRSKEIAKIDTLIEGGGEAAVTMRVKEGNIKIVEASP